MKKIVLLLSLLFALSAQAQTVTEMGDAYGGVQGALVSNNDAVRLRLRGTQWATAQFSVINGGTAVVVAEISIDGGTNFFTSAYGKKISAVSANPSVAQISGALTTGDAWEIPLPSNATNFQLRCTSGGTSTTVKILGGLGYAPGTPVVAVLYDVTSGVASALDTGTIDTSGWMMVQHYLTMNGGTPAFSSQQVDDAGTSSANLNTWTVASLGGYSSLGASNGGAGAVVGIAAATNTGLPKRIRYQSAAITSQTSRIRLEARR